MTKWILFFLMIFAVPVFAAPPESCIDIPATSTDQSASFSFKGCPIVFNFSTKIAYASFYGMPATITSTPVPAASDPTIPGAVGICVVPTTVVHVIMAGSDTGNLRICNYGGLQ